MASLTLTGDSNGFTWKISGLEKPFLPKSYIRVGITRNPFTVGGVSSISGIMDYKKSGSGGTSVSQYLTYKPSTYDFWGFAETTGGGYWPCGSDRVTVGGGGGPSQRDFEWNYAGIDLSTGSPIYGTRKRSGLGIYVTAGEWNSLVDNVNDRLGRNFGHVSRSEGISASVVNQISSAVGTGYVQSGSTKISASFFNDLMDAVNQS